MGGMIAQALAVLHPAQVRRLVLCATYPGTGQAVSPSAGGNRQAGSIFPANQASAAGRVPGGDRGVPAAPAVSAAAKAGQAGAVTDWWDGHDAAGREIARISVPTLIADGTDDQIDPVANDHTLARLIPRSSWCSTPTPGTGSCSRTGPRFAALTESFLTGHPSS